MILSLFYKYMFYSNYTFYKYKTELCVSSHIGSLWNNLKIKNDLWKRGKATLRDFIFFS
jgi:hypothetical protein